MSKIVNNYKTSIVSMALKDEDGINGLKVFNGFKVFNGIKFFNGIHFFNGIKVFNGL